MGVGLLRAQFSRKKDYVIVAGDLNDEPDSAPLRPLVATPGLHNVLDIAKHPADDRWTYFYGSKKQYNTIDYIFVSEALRTKVTAAGLERRGMFDLVTLTKGKQSSFPGIDHWKLAASDHAAVWADLNI